MSQSKQDENPFEENENKAQAEDQTTEEVVAADSAESEEGEVTIESLQEELETVRASADKNWDTVLRMKAEADNQRKRAEKQVQDAHKFAVQKFVGELLPVADSLEMGMAAEGDIEQIREGMSLTMNVLNKALEKFSVEAVDPLGEKFDPELHQAMAMQPSEEYEEGHVSAVMQKGYTLSGRLVRPAMVMVVKN
ncbi:MAG: nucleotide exchange factor GrpE [Cocleimonas sp.]|nr:nucleotide exchange factor GrpE [Cocleimonas sp.]